MSRAIELGVGECLEKAILVQLAKQEETDAFFIMGILRHDKMRGGILHAFNVVYTDGKPFLIDAENPVIIRNGDEKRTPRLGINRKIQRRKYYSTLVMR